MIVGQRTPVSLVCVSNNPGVLHDCLIRSVDRLRSTAPRTEVIVVENSKRQFSSAGAALNHGASLATNDVCVFVHQDVYLHSLVCLEELASVVSFDTAVGVAGASGVTSGGELLGRIRDRVVLTGRAVVGLAEVDSLDELLFLARRQQVLEAPLSENPRLAWHGYAVEYAARMRRAGKRVVVGRIPVTHNSLTANMVGLSQAHTYVGLRYPEQLPISTTCGVIDHRSADAHKFLANQRWRYRWLKGTWKAHRVRRAIGPLPVALADIRMDLDQVLADCGESRLHVLALASDEEHDADLLEAIELDRNGRSIRLGVSTLAEIADELSASHPDGRSLLITNLDVDSLSNLRGGLHAQRDVLVGFADEIGFWLLMGAAATGSCDAWRLPRARPLGASSQI